MDPWMIFQLPKNKNYSVRMHCHVTELFPTFTQYEAWPPAKTFTRNNCLLKQTAWPNYVIPWDPTTMANVPLSCEWTDAQTNKASATFTLGGVTNTMNNQASPGSANWTCLANALPVDINLLSTKVSVTTNIPTNCNDTNRSDALHVTIPLCQFCGLYRDVDKITGKDNSRYRYRIYYTLQDNANASSGVIWFYYYNTNMNQWAYFEYPPLTSLEASSTGITYYYELDVYKWMIDSTTKPCFFAVHVMDGHADAYKDNRPRAAMEAIKPALHPIMTAQNYDGNELTKYCAEEARTRQIDLPDWSTYDAFATTEADPATAMTEAQDATILYIVNHGSDTGGQILMNGSRNNWSAAGRWAAKQPQNEQNTLLAYITTNNPNTAHHFSKMKLAAFVGCNTADNDLIYGCLPTEAVNCGAQSSVGLADPVYFSGNFNCIRLFTRYFWYEATGRNTVNGITSVAAAWNNAVEDLKSDQDNEFGNAMGYDTKYWCGTPSSVFLAPAIPR